MKAKKILIVEPYYGGSHKYFLDGLQRCVDTQYTLLSLPARKWKMRMQLSALWFAEQVREFPCEERWFDTVLCSTFVDVAVLRSLLYNVESTNRNATYLTYFHENQFAYPGQLTDMSNHQFTAINFTTALVSDRLAFNSSFNLTSFLDGCEKYLKKATDMKFKGSLQTLRKKCSVIYPGIESELIDAIPREKLSSTPTIVWNHRWEHDKNPQAFFNALYELKKEHIPFKLIVLGQSFQNQPPCFLEAQKQLKEEIVHFGYAESRKEYVHFLRQGDIVVSTSLHEFFGISVLEAVRAGCRPLVPNRLSYPELFDDKYLYSEGSLVKKSKALLLSGGGFDVDTGRAITNKFTWSQLKNNYIKWMFEG